jgi:hypothetical protein
VRAHNHVRALNCAAASLIAGAPAPRLLVAAKERVSLFRRCGLVSDGTLIVAYSSALPMSMPHTRSRYSGSSVTSSTGLSPLPCLDGRRWSALACEAGPPGEPGAARKLTRVLVATVNGPSESGSRRQASPRPQPRPWK